MALIEPLGVVVGVKHDRHSGLEVHDLPHVIVLDIVPGDVAGETMHMLQFQHRVRQVVPHTLHVEVLRHLFPQKRPPLLLPHVVLLRRQVQSLFDVVVPLVRDEFVQF